MARQVAAARALKANRARQAEERLRAGSEWQDTWGLVFTNPLGAPLHGSNVTRYFRQVLQRAGLPQQRFHDLRHTFASLLIANGEDIVRVSRLLGHVSPAITLNVYSHMLPNEHYGTADRLGDFVFGQVPPDSAGQSRTIGE